MFLDFGLRAEYKIRFAMPDEMESSDKHIFYKSFDESKIQFPLHTVISINHPLTETWFCALQGFMEAPYVEGAHACPSPKHFVVIHNAVAFYIDALNPGCISIVANSVNKIEKYIAFDLLLLLSFDTITAIGKEGVLWSTPRLVLDGLRLISVNEDIIFGEGDHIHEDGSGEFKISTKDGSIVEANCFLNDPY